MQDAFNVILLTSADICVVHDDLGWKNRTRSDASLALRVIFSGGTTKQHIIIAGFGSAGCSRLEYVDNLLSILTPYI